MKSILWALLALFGAVPVLAGTQIADLRSEYLSNPIGIQTATPQLSWKIRSDRRNVRQNAYQIQAASAADQLTVGTSLLWDTGRIASSETAQIRYNGRKLGSSSRCWWRVRSWDEAGRATGWSAPAWFETGLLQPQDWKARWIARTEDKNYQAAPYFRRTFRIGKPIVSARMYISGLGYYELHCNGKRVGDRLLDPGYTRYDRRAVYVTYDMTNALRDGDNTLGVILGTGWLNVHTRAVWYFDRAPWRVSPRVCAQLRIRYQDGSSETIGTDKRWTTATGPITFDSIYGGETYDARQSLDGWDLPSYTGSSWSTAIEVSPPGGALWAMTMPPIRATTMPPAKSIREPKPGVYLFDMGQNLSGHARLTVSAPAGTRIVLRYGERLHPDGTLDASHIQQHQTKTDPPQQFQTDSYICSGKGTEVWESRFDYHGFQYVEVTGLPSRPTRQTLRAVFTHTDLAPAGEFSCSSTLLDRIWRNTRWSYLSNTASIPTDCPHREKNGWTGDAHLAAEQGLLNYDGISFYKKWIDDLNDEQRPTGELPGIVPSSGWGYEWGNGPAWDSAYLLIPWYLYLYYGDVDVLAQHYKGMRLYVDYLTSRAKNGIVSIGLGDWVPWKTETPVEVTSTGYYYQDALIVSRAAALIGNRADAERYAKLAQSIRAAFNAAFYHADAHTYSNGGQTSLSCALYQGLAPDAEREAIAKSLVASVDAANGHIDTGILGAKYLLNTLSDNGHADVAYRIASQEEKPGWGWWIKQGASTLWESWDGNDSRNHIMFGDISAWFVKSIAGIQPDPARPGFRHIRIKPNIVGDLVQARAHYESIRGRIASSWQLANGRLTLIVDIPANTTATISVPSAHPDQVYDDGEFATPTSRSALRPARVEPGYAVFQVGSGHYRFRSLWSRDGR